MLRRSTVIIWKDEPEKVIVLCGKNDMLREEVSRVPCVVIRAGIWVALTSNPKYVPNPIAYKYREGKLKSNPKG